MLLRSPILGACTLAIVPVVGILNKVYGTWLSKNASKVQSQLANATSCAHESLACIKTVITLACEDHEREKYRREVRNGRFPRHFVLLAYFAFILQALGLLITSCAVYTRSTRCTISTYSN